MSPLNIILKFVMNKTDVDVLDSLGVADRKAIAQTTVHAMILSNMESRTEYYELRKITQVTSFYNNVLADLCADHGLENQFGTIYEYAIQYKAKCFVVYENVKIYEFRSTMITMKASNTRVEKSIFFTERMGKIIKYHDDI